MFFHLTGIKDISEKNYTLELLIEWPDVSSVKHFLADQKVIILGLEHYTPEPKSFWNVYLDIQWWDQVFKIVGQFQKIEEFLSYVVKLKLKVIDANYFDSPLSSEKIQAMLQSAYHQEEQSEILIKKEKEKADKKERLNFKDKKLAKAYDAIDLVINQIDQLLSIGGKNILPTAKKKLDDMRWEISKLRLATNYDKILEELHKTMNFIVETQDFLLKELEAEKIFTIVPKSHVTNVEVIREQTKLAKARLLSSLWANLPNEDTMYVSLGYLKLFGEYLYKDIHIASQNKLTLARYVFMGIELMLIFLLLEMVILSVFSEPLGIGLSFQRFWMIFIYGSVLARLFRIANEYIHPQKLSHYVWLFLWIIWIYIPVIALIKLILVF